jgi:hypothetical protein
MNIQPLETETTQGASLTITDKLFDIIYAVYELKQKQFGAGNLTTQSTFQSR